MAPRSAREARAALGKRLRDIRADAHLTGRQLAALAGWHYTKVSKIEHGTTMPTETDLELWCFHCTAQAELPDLIATARNVEQMYAELRRLHRAGIAGYQRDLLAEQSRNRRFRMFSTSAVPGPLRTEHVLRSSMAPPEVMLAQLEHLLDAAPLPQVHFGVLPTSVRRYTPFCSFWITEDRYVEIETFSAMIRIDQPREIAIYARVFDHYARNAVYGREAVEVIQDARSDHRAAI